MGVETLTEHIVGQFPSLPAQLQRAARYVLDNPDDVALLSMREQARRAGLPPWTMTRLAKRLGFAGYDAVRAIYADAVREGTLGFAGRAGAQVRSQRDRGDEALAADIIVAMSGQVARLVEPAVLAALSDAASLLHGARRIYCIGLRSSHAAAAHFAYLMSLFGDKVLLVDGGAPNGPEMIRFAGEADVVLAVSVAPYTKATVEAARLARPTGARLVAITDSPVAPLAQLAHCTVLVTTEGPAFFHTMTPAFAAIEVVCALVAGRGGERSLEALQEAERHLATLSVHWQPSTAKQS